MYNNKIQINYSCYETNVCLVKINHENNRSFSREMKCKHDGVATNSAKLWAKYSFDKKMLLDKT